MRARVEIAVGFLCRRDDRDEIVEPSVERGIGSDRERVRRRFDDLVDVGVVVALALVVPSILCAALRKLSMRPVCSFCAGCAES